MIFFILKLCLLINLTSCLLNRGGLRKNQTGVQSGRDIKTINPSSTESVEALPKIRLQHIIDPYDGNYKDKVTIHKGFSGALLIAGLNIYRLKEQGGVKIRLKLGKDLAPVILPATIIPSFIPGLTATNPMDVIRVDFSGKDEDHPLKYKKLPYHLYDYNQYAPDEEPISDPFHESLYCRGLANKHNPSFFSQSQSAKCSLEGDRCLYSYASVFDQGLYAGHSPLVPSKLQLAFNETGLYANETSLERSAKCLADNGNDTYTLGANFPIPKTGSLGLTVFSVDGVDYTYRGPYQAKNIDQWEITGEAVTGRDSEGNFWGLFEHLAHPLDFNTGFHSLKFPRAGRLPIRANREYIGEDTLPTVTSHGPRRPHFAAQDLDESLLMDGCNLRISRDQISRDGIESCNITGLIEIVKQDDETGIYRVVEGTVTADLKIQIIHNTTKTPLSEENLISTSFRSCHSNQGCGGDECCYNNRCWSKNIVTKCIENPLKTQLKNGAKCSYDSDCKSLCCSGGACKAHDGQQNLCSKPIGASCISSEFCSKVLQTHYFPREIIVDEQTGEKICQIDQKNVYVFAQCALSGNRGYCQTPPSPPKPTIDPNDPTCE